METKKRLYPGQAETRQRKRLKAKGIATRGENLACAFLEERSFKVLARNFRAGRAGEIDVVALDESGTVVFVEVKARTIDKREFGIPEIGFEAVGYRKQRRILIASQKFLTEAKFVVRRWRYDVIVVLVWRDSLVGPEIVHVENAFCF